MDQVPYIVDIDVTNESFSAALGVAIPEARLLRALAPRRVVVVVSPARESELAAVPGVTAVARDRPERPLRRRE